MEYIVGGGALLLAAIWSWFYITQKSNEKKHLDLIKEHTHPWKDIHAVLKGNNSGGTWRNRTWKPNPGFNDEFAGVVPGTCGQIRPGEWQCNCADPKNGCLVLNKLRSEDQPSEERTDRRGAIAAQKARNKNGR